MLILKQRLVLRGFTAYLCRVLKSLGAVHAAKAASEGRGVPREESHRRVAGSRTQYVRKAAWRTVRDDGLRLSALIYAASPSQATCYGYAQLSEGVIRLTGPEPAAQISPVWGTWAPRSTLQAGLLLLDLTGYREGLSEDSAIGCPANRPVLRGGL